MPVHGRLLAGSWAVYHRFMSGLSLARRGVFLVFSGVFGRFPSVFDRFQSSSGVFERFHLFSVCLGSLLVGVLAVSGVFGCFRTLPALSVVFGYFRPFSCHCRWFSGVFLRFPAFFWRPTGSGA